MKEWITASFFVDRGLAGLDGSIAYSFTLVPGRLVKRTLCKIHPWSKYDSVPAVALCSAHTLGHGPCGYKCSIGTKKPYGRSDSQVRILIFCVGTPDIVLDTGLVSCSRHP
jgi:hypothetical protein